MATSNSKEFKKTIRHDSESLKVLERLTKKLSMNESECTRFAILQLEKQEGTTALPILCSMCSVVNKVMERYDLSEADREYLNKEMGNIWQQLK